MEYKKTPLKEVIVRIDFDKISINKTNNFSKIVKNYFPNESFREINEKVIKIKNDDKWIKDSKVENVSRFEYIYTTNNNENSVKLTRNTLLIHYLEYKNHAELYKHIEILNSLIKEFNIKTINRLW